MSAGYHFPWRLDVITIGLAQTLLKPNYGGDIETSAYKL
jgi:hypothetical protein